MNIDSIRERSLPILTIMIPVRNESSYIGNTLKQISEQSFPQELYEVIVVDGESDDDTADIVEQFSNKHSSMNIILLRNPKRLSSTARNIAIKKSRGEYILLIDGHVHLPNKHLLKNCIDAAEKSSALVVGRPQPLDPPDNTAFQKAVALARSSVLAHSQESYIYSDFEGFTSPISIGVMYHKSVFSKIGFFDESYDAAEDCEFNYRLEKAGYRCFTSPDLAVRYYPRGSFNTLFHQLKRYGIGRANFVSKNPERFTFEILAPVFFLIFIFGAPLFFMFSLFKFLWLLGACAYLSLLSIESLRFGYKHWLSDFYLIPPIIATIHLGLGWGLIKGFSRLNSDDVTQFLSRIPILKKVSMS